ncbi:MAG TPA: hypothetical protein VH985_25820, partial [Candidatus Binatia bacterium]
MNLPMPSFIELRRARLLLDESDTVARENQLPNQYRQLLLRQNGISPRIKNTTEPSNLSNV